MINLAKLGYLVVTLLVLPHAQAQLDHSLVINVKQDQALKIAIDISHRLGGYADKNYVKISPPAWFCKCWTVYFKVPGSHLSVAISSENGDVWLYQNTSLYVERKHRKSKALAPSVIHASSASTQIQDMASRLEGNRNLKLVSLDVESDGDINTESGCSTVTGILAPVIHGYPHLFSGMMISIDGLTGKVLYYRRTTHPAPTSSATLNISREQAISSSHVDPTSKGFEAVLGWATPHNEPVARLYWRVKSQKRQRYVDATTGEVVQGI